MLENLIKKPPPFKFKLKPLWNLIKVVFEGHGEPKLI